MAARHANCRYVNHEHGRYRVEARRVPLRGLWLAGCFDSAQAQRCQRRLLRQLRLEPGVLGRIPPQDRSGPDGRAGGQGAPRHRGGPDREHPGRGLRASRLRPHARRCPDPAGTAGSKKASAARGIGQGPPGAFAASIEAHGSGQEKPSTARHPWPACQMPFQVAPSPDVASIAGPSHSVF